MDKYMEKATTITCNCGNTLKLKVCQSDVGFYLGHWCNCCGPYDRKSDYYRTKKATQEVLDEILT